MKGADVFVGLSKGNVLSQDMINYCYWNKCSFCGINHKYCTQNERQKWNIPEAINILKERNKNGNRYIWLTDEAIPPIILKKLLIKFTENQFNFIWHFRTRIEPELLDPELIELVKNNGVKSIILGFESASERILRLMKKTFVVIIYPLQKRL